MSSSFPRLFISDLWFTIYFEQHPQVKQIGLLDAQNNIAL